MNQKRCVQCAATTGHQCSPCRRWNYAIDRLLNSGTLLYHMGDFWRFIDGKLTYAEYDERAPG